MIQDSKISVQYVWDTIVLLQRYTDAVFPSTSVSDLNQKHACGYATIHESALSNGSALLLSNTSHCINACVSKPVTTD